MGPIEINLALLIGILVGKAVQKSRMSETIKKERLDAVKKSRAVLGGQFGERIASAWMDWKYPNAAQFPLVVTSDKVEPEER